MPRILLVDDSATNLKYLTDAIRGNGYTTLVATDGESALEQVQYMAPHLILLDVMMPGMDGFETCRQLKANSATQAIPIIFMTALSESVDRIKGLSLGAVDYITKPFQPEEVIARVNLHLQLSQLNQALAVKNAALEDKIAQKEVIEAELTSLNENLERHVQARTKQLSSSLQQLQETQLRLIQSEKMSALGQLVAGVGSEISNPVCVISGNLDCIQDYVAGLIELLAMHRAEHPEVSKAIAQKAADIELDYIIDDMPKLLASMRQGTERILEISTSLRTLARGANPSQIDFSLHECLDSALLLLQHRINANDRRPTVRIIKRYGYLPLIRCHPGQLNQVFMNLLANALDAFDLASDQLSYELVEKSPHVITLKSHIDEANKQAIISISDNGPGIHPDIRAKVFEPLYTDKVSQQSIGLGLAICRHIVEENHRGHLACQSAQGQGTTLVLTLPIDGTSGRFEATGLE